MMRTYSGHSTAKASNELYRTNLAKGQTGLSIAFDLPTQTGYDPDDPLGPRRGRQGRRAGRPPRPHGAAARQHPRRRDEHVDDDQRHRRPGCSASTWPTPRTRASSRRQLRGTTQNDIVKEYLSRGTYIFPPLPSRRLIVDMIAFCAGVGPAVEPDERVQLPPAGGRGHAGAGDRLRAGHRHRRARRGARSRARCPRTACPTWSPRSRSS